MDRNVCFLVLMFVICSEYKCFIGAASQSGIKGQYVELQCGYKSTDKIILWSKGIAGLSEGTTIYPHIQPDEFRQRLSISGNHANGEYHLTISNLEVTDAGTYSCALSGVGQSESVQLSIIEGPVSASIAGKTEDNKLIGTEDEPITISCTALSEDPSPDMVLQIQNQNFTRSGTKTIQQTIQRLDRNYDGGLIKCLAGYHRFSYFMVEDSATFYPRLKPSIPAFTSDTIEAEETKSLSISCTSSGGRPEPTERLWTIGNTDVTSSSTLSSVHVPASDTYTVTSTLTLNVSRNDNGKTITCGVKNDATGSIITSNRAINVKFAPSVSVDNKTYSSIDSLRNLTCAANGNPQDYIYSKWQHKTLYGKDIRELEGNITLTLPQVSEKNRYQDTGEYVCTVSNGINGSNGVINQHASGFVSSQARPIFHGDSYLEKLGQTRNDVDLVVDVYSDPMYTSLSWKKGSKNITSSFKYTMNSVPSMLTDTFHGTEVQVGGYRLTLTIHYLEEQDFDNYTLRIGNVVGPTEYLIILLSASPPEVPTNFTLIGSTETTVTLQWLPAFDGGHEQTFFIEYRITGTVEWKKAEVPKTLQATDDNLKSYTLSGLADGTSYDVRMYAVNIYDRSNVTDFFQVSTIDIISSSENPGHGAVIGAVVGVLSGGAVVVAIVTLVIVRRRKCRSEAKGKLRSEFHSDEDVDPNRTQGEGCEYAEVQKQNAVYAVVKKPELQMNKEIKQKDTKNPAKKKKRPKASTNNNSAGDVYANQSDYASSEAPSGGYKNANGLQYADLTFPNPPKSKDGKAVIHGLEERTIYSVVDHTKKAPPLPQEGAYELTDISQN